MSKQPTEVELLVTELGEDGLGHSELNERPVWVRNALPGETVKARILKRRRGIRFADGEWLADAHPDRQPSACEYFPRCGGCSLHHLSYAAQLRHKEAGLHKQLARVGIEPDSLPWRKPVGEVRLGYRRKARLGVRALGDRVLVGFRESFSSRVAQISHCQTLTPELSRLLVPLQQLLPQLSIADAVPQIEFAQGDVDICVMLRHLKPLSDADLGLLQDFARQQRVELLLQSKGYDSLANVFNQAPPQHLTYQLQDYGLTLGFFPDQFIQVNTRMNRELVSTVMGYLHPLPGLKLLDLFCGVGNFSLPAARLGAQVYGLEFSDAAVAMAEVNAARNRLGGKARFGVADLYSTESLPNVSSQSEASSAYDALLLDPPRSGAGPHLANWLAQTKLSRIVYVSCNPATFADDAKIILDAGFSFQEVGVYDLFPQTAHVETIGVFQR